MEGVGFVYSRFVTVGAFFMALVLEANGYTPYGRQSGFLANKVQSPGGLQCALCSQREKEHAGADHTFVSAKYVLLTGDPLLSPNNAAAITAARALISDANGIPTHSTVTSAELAQLSGITSGAVSLNGVQSLTNKSLVDSSTAIVDATDATKQIKFDAAGTTGTSTTLTSSQTANRVITLPDVTGTVITTGDTGSVTSTMIADGTIVNADINATAAIARTKIASGTNYRLLANSATGVMSENAALTSTRIPFADANGQLTDASDFTASTNAITLANTKHLELQAATDSTTTGTNASLAAFTGAGVRLTNASLVSLANIPAGANGQELIVFNRTGVDLTIADESAAVGTAANRIFTGTSAAVSFKKNAAMLFSSSHILLTKYYYSRRT
jgi:hypothetical protein